MIQTCENTIFSGPYRIIDPHNCERPAKYRVTIRKTVIDTVTLCYCPICLATAKRRGEHFESIEEMQVNEAEYKASLKKIRDYQKYLKEKYS